MNKILVRKKYKNLHEAEILTNAEMMSAIQENNRAKKKGIKTWELKTRL